MVCVYSTMRSASEPDPPIRPINPPNPRPNSPKPMFQIDDGKTYFKLLPGTGASRITSFPYTVQLEVAYQNLYGDGDALKNYSPFDFDFKDTSQIKITEKNCNVKSKDLNNLELEINNLDFELKVDGFAEHKLVIRTK